MGPQFLNLYDRIFLSHTRLTVIVLSVLLGILISGIRYSEFDASAESLVLEGDKDLEYSREISKRYQSEDFLLATYRPHRPLFSLHTRQSLASLRDQLLKVEGVASINSILDVPLLYSPPIDLSDLSEGLKTIQSPGVDLDLAAEEFLHSPVYRQLLTNSDNTVTVLQINLSRDERYYQLLSQREALRVLRRAETASSVQLAELDDIEQQFDDYLLVIADRQQYLVATVRHILTDYRGDATIFLGGVPMIAVDMVSFVKADLAVFGSAIVLFIVIVLWLIFRSVQWVVIPLLVCSVNAASLLGLLGWLDWRLTVISSNLVAILLIVNLAILIHLIVRYREMLNLNPDWEQRLLVLQTVGFMFKPCLYTTLTTLVAFASLVASGIRPVIDFGWMMCIGVGLALILSFILLPVLLMLGGKHKPTTSSFDEGVVPLKFARMADNHSARITVFTLAIFFFSLIGVSQLKVENRFIDYFHKDTEIYQGMMTIDQELGGTIPLEVLIDASHEQLVIAGLATETVVDKPMAAVDNTADSEEFDDEFAEMFGDDEFSDDFASDADDGARNNIWFTVAGLKKVQQVHSYLEGLPETGKVMSLATVYQVVEDVLGDNVDDIQLSLAKDKLPDSVQNVLIAPYLSEQYHQARISLRVKETSETLQRDELLKKIHSDIVNQFELQPEQVHLTGMLVLYNNMLQSLYRSQILTLAVVFVAITAMFLLLFRSVKLALIGVTPNILVAVLVLGSMGWVGIPLDMMTITIAAIGIGIGVDDNIHYIHRFGREFAEVGNYRQAMYRSHQSIGRAVFYTSAIIVIGFSVLVLSNFTPSIYFGLLTSFAMLAALVGALLLLPRLLIWLKPFGPETAGYNTTTATA
ncbi:hypothetical protein SIN8267_02539 [Sinobacterium norvegicum]|uniref:SSD domain-containing protein n=1 Tax=Sinobacterium norvegicum TaxID=1641715 RepID=A0ABM9AGT6_9GAMM|nr:MMPL family transporter [Sinobacterium norvegicum]CAH0992419.1 hypothetical protein SIN8267_02539 [Sinobacterium norvegicum]